jgi:DNA-directed RNA polymerase beta' subunit
MSDLPDYSVQPATLADHPDIYVKNRAARLSRLVELSAPMVAIENEFKLLTAAMEALRAKEGASSRR